MTGESKPYQLCHTEVNCFSNTCLAEAVNNQTLIPVMLSTVTSVSKALGLEKEMVGIGKEIYKDWVCLSKCEFNNASHQAN